MVHSQPDLFGYGEYLSIVNDILMNREPVGTGPGSKVPDAFVIVQDFLYAGFPVFVTGLTNGHFEFIAPFASFSRAVVL